MLIMIIKSKRAGFTIVELLIVIVVIGILAAITIVAYNGIQQRGRDSARRADVSSIKKLLSSIMRIIMRTHNGLTLSRLVLLSH
jgi:prepilin-type N-terminal cleavage/methylation domain-containing protein